MTGKIRRFLSDRGFGFITPDDRTQTEVFVHIRALRSGELKTGVRVSYEIGQDKLQRPRAENVHVIEHDVQPVQPLEAHNGD